MNILKFLGVAVCLASSCSGQTVRPGGPTYAPLWLYEGSWRLTPKTAMGEEKTNLVDNSCHLFGKYFACQQTVNGKIGGLIVFVPAEKPGHYYTQAINPDGRATGRGELEISGEHWIYSSSYEDSGKTIYHRTKNDFSGNDKIHFEQAESFDGEHWTVKGSGDEERVTGNPAK